MKQNSCPHCSPWKNKSNDYFSNYQIKQYFQSNNIKSITLIDNGKLLIEYKQGESKTFLVNNDELSRIKTYCQSQNLKTINLSNLQNTQQGNNKPTNYLPCILGVVGLLTTIIGIIYFAKDKKGIK